MELAAPTPVKALKSGAALMMLTPTDDAAWVMRYQVATERLRTREATAKVGASAQEVAGLGDAPWESGPIEAALGDARLDVPGVGGSEPGSTAMTRQPPRPLRLKHPSVTWGGWMLKS